MTEDHPLSVVRDCLYNILQPEEERKVYKILVGKPEGKRLIGRPMCRWENGIGMDLKQIDLGGCGLDSTGSRIRTGGGLL
jgi:hypothetical protein